MSMFSTRTVRTFFQSGDDQPRTTTKTYTFGDPQGMNIGFGGDKDFSVGFGGGKNFGINLSDFGFGSRSGGGGGGGRRCIRGPEVVGRSSRREKRNPFAGLTKQSYDDIKKRCLEEGILFEDPEFPAEDHSIFFSRSPPRPFEWKRPTEICDNPEWISEGASRFDVRQGELGDCWLLAAVASLTCDSKLFHRVVVPEQNFSDGYCGLFKFNFWHQGEWTEVVVDDRLPTYHGQLVFMHSTEKNEFWSALLEKAYAKLNGSYESLKGGSTSEAMEDFTGGVTEMFDLRNAPPNLLQIMLKATERKALMGCSIDADPSQLEAELSNGLIMGHAYSITAVKLMDITTSKVSGKIPMVRVRNPWGNECEWKGAWSDQSQEWNLITPEEKQELGLTFDDDGEFWMSYRDWSSNFQKLEICNLGPDALDEDDLQNRKKWETYVEHGDWVRRVNAGGCRNYLDTFATNPQYRVTLTDPDEDDEEDLCTLLVAIMQKDRRKKRKEGLDLLTIGYVIYKIPDGQGESPLDMKFFKYNASVAKSPNFINMREVCGRHKLPPGTYAIIPSTFEPHQEGGFLIRIFTEKPNISGEMDEQTGYVDDGHRLGPAPNPQPVAPAARGPGRAGPPPTDEERAQEDTLKRNFQQMAGEDMEIDAYELRDILNAVFTKEFTFDGFPLDSCRSMVAMHDGDLSGKLGYDEFKALWNDLRKWKAVFKTYDADKSGFLSSYELRSALNSVGFRLSNKTFQSLVMRYSNKQGQVEFGDFIVCAIRLKTMLTSYKTMEIEGKGVAAMDVETFTQTTMYS